MIVKKTLRNAAIGTVAAGAMILPAATTVAPPMQLMACNYPDSKATSTSQELSRYIIKRGAVRSVVTLSNPLASNDTPNGKVIVKVYRPNGGLKATKSKTVTGNSRTATFRFGGFPRAKQSRTWEFVATFRGYCQYANSSDSDRLVVQGKGRR